MFKISKIFFLVSITLLVYSCSGNFFKRSDIKDNPVNVDERVRKNIEEGRGIRFGFGKDGGKGGTFDFASSNELWRASVDTLDFVPLINASYSGGIIITDWFNGTNNNNQNNNTRDLKITVKFLSNEIRADSLDVIVHEKICDNQQNNCSTSLIQNDLSNEIKIAILKKAAFLEKNKIDKIVLENKKKRPKIDN